MDVSQYQQSEPVVMRMSADPAPTLLPFRSFTESTLPAVPAGPIEFDIPLLKRERWAASFVARYGDLESWDLEPWSRHLPAISAQLRRTELSKLNRDTGEIRPDIFLKRTRESLPDEHDQAFGHVVLMAAHGETMGFPISRIHAELAPYWRFSMLHSVAPAVGEIYRWFSGQQCDSAPKAKVDTFSTMAAIEAVRTQLRRFFHTCGGDRYDRETWDVVAERISTTLPNFVDESTPSQRERLDRTARELLRKIYQDDDRFRGTLAAKIACDQLPSLEQKLSRMDTRYNGAHGHLERARNRSEMFSCMVSAVTMCELRSRPKGPHHETIKFLQGVMNTVKAHQRYRVRELKTAIEDLREDCER